MTKGLWAWHRRISDICARIQLNGLGRAYRYDNIVWWALTRDGSEGPLGNPRSPSCPGKNTTCSNYIKTKYSVSSDLNSKLSRPALCATLMQLPAGYLRDNRFYSSFSFAQFRLANGQPPRGISSLRHRSCVITPTNTSLFTTQKTTRSGDWWSVKSLLSCRCVAEMLILEIPPPPPPAFEVSIGFPLDACDSDPSQKKLFCYQASEKKMAKTYKLFQKSWNRVLEYTCGVLRSPPQFHPLNKIGKKAPGNRGPDRLENVSHFRQERCLFRPERAETLPCWVAHPQINIFGCGLGAGAPLLPLQLGSCTCPCGELVALVFTRRTAWWPSWPKMSSPSSCRTGCNRT